MNTNAYRAALIRKIEKEMDRLDAQLSQGGLYADFSDLLTGQQQGLSHVLWLIKDTEDL